MSSLSTTDDRIRLLPTQGDPEKPDDHLLSLPIHPRARSDPVRAAMPSISHPPRGAKSRASARFFADDEDSEVCSARNSECAPIPGSNGTNGNIERMSASDTRGIHAPVGFDQVRAADRAYALVKDRLTEGVYKAGESLRVSALSRELGVSKQPVMESLRRLSAEGFVTITPQVGCKVVRQDEDEIRDFFRLFAAGEGAATAMAAERRTEEELERLRAVSSRIGDLRYDLSSEARAHGYRVLNREFHSLIHEMSHTSIVEALGSSFFDRSDFFINGAAPVSPFADSLDARHADHEEIVAALESGDAEAARRAAETHILGAVALIEAAVRRGAHPATG